MLNYKRNRQARHLPNYRATAASVNTLLAITVMLVLPRNAGAQYDTTLNSSGDWDNPVNWSSGVPTSNANVWIENNLTVSATTGVSGSAANIYADFNGALNINGGSVSCLSGNIGTFPGSSGTANVSSGTWTNSSGLYIGQFGTGTLNINGGVVGDTNGSVGTSGSSAVAISSSGEISYSLPSDGTVAVTSGTWMNSSGLVLGDGGTGTLSVSGSGVVTIANGSGTLTIGSQAASVGILNLGTGGTAGTLGAAAVFGGSGTATVNFNHTGSYTFSPLLTGNLSVNKLGSGTTTLTGSSNYTSITTVKVGTLALGALGSVSNSPLIAVKDGAIFDTTAQNFTMLSSQTFKFTLNGTTGAAGLLNAGTINITNGNVDFEALGTLDDPAYVIVAYSTLEGAAFNSALDLPTGYSLDYDYHATNEIALVKTVPEPSTWTLLVGGVGLLAFRQKVRRWFKSHILRRKQLC